MSKPANANTNGKGDQYRPINKERYDWNYIKTCGVTCPKCDGIQGGCHYCDGKKLFDPEYYYALGGT